MRLKKLHHNKRKKLGFLNRKQRRKQILFTFDEIISKLESVTIWDELWSFNQEEYGKNLEIRFE